MGVIYSGSIGTIIGWSLFKYPPRTKLYKRTQKYNAMVQGIRFGTKRLRSRRLGVGRNGAWKEWGNRAERRQDKHLVLTAHGIISDSREHGQGIHKLTQHQKLSRFKSNMGLRKMQRKMQAAGAYIAKRMAMQASMAEAFNRPSRY